jgi:hypothetical protein
MVRVRTEQVIDVGDWDSLVIETYGKPYNFQQQDGCKERQHVKITIPDGAYDDEKETILEVVNGEEMGVSFKAWLDRDPLKKLDSKDSWDREHGLSMWWERNFYPDVQMVANDLHSKGLIEAGKYTINIDW